MSLLNYKKAGVDIEGANRFLRKIKPLLKQTERPEVLGKIGGFSGLFLPRIKSVKNPVLVSSADGVGTKLIIAEALGKYDSVGIDLVAMCADDVVVTGAEPLFFLDYIACGKLNQKKLCNLIQGMAEGCKEAGCTLIGGETAELPGMYEKGKFDIAGFCVGLVSREKIIDGKRCKEGDNLIGLASNGVHSNGFSLIRKVLSEDELKGNIGKELLKPTKIYTKSILRVMQKVAIKAMAHITGGGFYDNIPRVLPEGLTARIEKGSWPVLSIFKKIQKKGQIEEKEMFHTFNMGIGMVVVVDPENAKRTVSLFEDMEVKAWIIGEIGKGKSGVKIFD